MVCSHSVCFGSCSSSSGAEFICCWLLGFCVVSDLGRMQMMLVVASSGVNITNFLVSLHTVPLLFACVGWDDAATTWQPIGKSLGEDGLGVFWVTSWCG